MFVTYTTTFHAVAMEDTKNAPLIMTLGVIQFFAGGGINH